MRQKNCAKEVNARAAVLEAQEELESQRVKAQQDQIAAEALLAERTKLHNTRYPENKTALPLVPKAPPAHLINIKELMGPAQTNTKKWTASVLAPSIGY